MNLAIHTSTQDSGTRPVERLGFDMLRAIVAARRSASTTARALATAASRPSAASGGEPGAGRHVSMDLLSGRAGHGHGPMGGAFADHDGCVHPPAIKGELHE